tara:strand:- start:168 stop:341 length:174 start_codon:yes stop_codon:yes gene_type:complete
MSATESRESTLKVNAQFEGVQQDQFYMPTWALISVLIVGFFVLKSFIYIKDDKRHGR